MMGSGINRGSTTQAIRKVNRSGERDEGEQSEIKRVRELVGDDVNDNQGDLQLRPEFLVGGEEEVAETKNRPVEIIRPLMISIGSNPQDRSAVLKLIPWYG
jgi:hypothetical protein